MEARMTDTREKSYLTNPPPRRADELVPSDARESVVLGYPRALMTYNMEQFESIWHDDAVHENAFLPEGALPAFVGRTQIVNHYRAAFQKRQNVVFTIKTLHRTAAPDCFIMEFRQTSFVPESGANYDQHYIGVFYLREEKIFHLRLYADPLAAQRALSTLLSKH
jgi:ketosteroid isomerase-like protein